MEWIEIKHGGLGELLPTEGEEVLTAEWHDIYGWMYKTGYWRPFAPENTNVWHGGNAKPSHWMRFKALKEIE